MSAREDLLALAARVEAATGPDRELDALIALAVGVLHGEPAKYGPAGWIAISPDHSRAAYRYTASLDAAMSLAGEWFFHLSRFPGDHVPRCNAHVYPNRSLGDDYEADAATPALVLTAACLRARAASGIETEGHDREDGHGAKHESPAPEGDAQPC